MTQSMGYHMKKSTSKTIETLGPDRIGKALVALTTYLRRSKGLDKPDGTWDRSGRFYPSDWEDANGDLTLRIREPSRSYPTTYWKAAHSLRHCAAVASSTEEDVKLTKKILEDIGLNLTTNGDLEKLKAQIAEAHLDTKLQSAENKAPRVRL